VPFVRNGRLRMLAVMVPNARRCSRGALGQRAALRPAIDTCTRCSPPHTPATVIES
jgi:hypothetical protein